MVLAAHVMSRADLTKSEDVAYIHGEKSGLSLVSRTGSPQVRVGCRKDTTL